MAVPLVANVGGRRQERQGALATAGIAGRLAPGDGFLDSGRKRPYYFLRAKYSLKLLS